VKITGAVYNGFGFLESNFTLEINESGCHHEHVSPENGLKHLKKTQEKLKMQHISNLKNKTDFHPISSLIKQRNIFV